MQYLCVVYFEPGTLASLMASEGDALTRDSLEYDDELRRRGHYLMSNALEPVGAATTVRVRNGKVLTTDGPFAETKEHLGGFILIEARDLNEAIRVAAGIPLAQLGSIEVRPIKPLTRGDRPVEPRM